MLSLLTFKKFERGTVSYMITSTMTRPTAISPTTTCDGKVNFLEDIDIAPLSIPKPRVITLEPIPRRTRTKRVKRASEKQPEKHVSEDVQLPEIGMNSRVVEVPTGLGDSDQPHSPVPSDVSFDSVLSSGGTGSGIDSTSPSARTGESKATGATHVHNHSLTRRPITATVEIQKAGFLRGDTIPIKVSVSHTKQIKSLHGVIVTLYRQARVDMHPALPVVNGGDDDMYPRSRTGLGGLSLSSAGSTHLFRKDLSQSFAALIINPDTLSAEVKTTIRVPEEAFPSIASVPGAMISFKYYVEIVLDLQGKLSGLDRLLPSSGVSAMSANDASGRPADSNGTVFSAWGGHFINTEDIRRDKSVVSCVFEVIVGTRDSERKSAWKQNPLTPEYEANDFADPQGNGGAINNNVWHHHGVNNGRYVGYGLEVHSTDLDQQVHQQFQYHPQQSLSNANDDAPPQMSRFPIPDFAEDEQNISEKERLRRAEARLLPSRPPEDGVESSASAGAHAPSAPIIQDSHDFPTSSAPGDADFHNSSTGPSAPPSTVFLPTLHQDTSPSAPAYHHHAPPPSSLAPTDDKHELHRRRLESERSAPEDLADVAEGSSAAETTPRARELAPSAPMLNEEDEFGFNFNVPSSSHHHSLPRYER
jgi:hypothetical protein